MLYSRSSQFLRAGGTRPGEGGVPARGGAVYAPALPPDALVSEFPLNAPSGPGARREERIAGWREELRAILDGEDHRLAVIAGPCSVHDPDAAREYAGLLAGAARALADDLLVIMRVFLEKPRTVTGWKGMAGDDPRMDGSAGPADGLRAARRLMLDITDAGLPVACELVSSSLHLHVGDILTWGAVGARTVESQVHREIASGRRHPVGFKNGTGGDVQAAVDACRAAAAPHRFRGCGPDGRLCDVQTEGNADCHVVLRGGKAGPNYGAGHVAEATGLLEAAGLPPRLMIDVSHGNSRKDASRQPEIAAAVAEQARRERAVRGVLMESFLDGGRQEPGPPGSLVYGRSVTDACLPWEQTPPVLENLAAAAGARR